MTPRLMAFGRDGHPKPLIASLSEDLLEAFRPLPLVDAYDVYQHLMDYWSATMQDDAYLIAADGWSAVPERLTETDKKGKTRDKGWSCELVPKSLVVDQFFARQQEAIAATQSELDAATASLTELEEEHGSEEGCLGMLDKVAKAEINARLREIRKDKDANDERAILEQWLQLADQEATLRKSLRDKEAELDALALAQYQHFTENDIKSLVIHHKWMANLTTTLEDELNRVSQSLTSRIRELAERYAEPLPQLTDEVAALAARVEKHLKKMGHHAAY